LVVVTGCGFLNNSMKWKVEGLRASGSHDIPELRNVYLCAFLRQAVRIFLRRGKNCVRKDEQEGWEKAERKRINP